MRRFFVVSDQSNNSLPSVMEIKCSSRSQAFVRYHKVRQTSRIYFPLFFRVSKGGILFAFFVEKDKSSLLIYAFLHLILPD